MKSKAEQLYDLIIGRACWVTVRDRMQEFSTIAGAVVKGREWALDLPYQLFAKEMKFLNSLSQDLDRRKLARWN